jgi:hypothetical protein
MPVAKQAKRKRAAVKVKVPTLATVRPPRSDLDVSNLVLTGPKVKGHKQLATHIQQAITGGTLETTIEGASTLTLTVTDASEGMLKSQLITGAVQLTFDNADYVLTKWARQDTIMTLTFEDRAVNVLRGYSKPKKADRANTTRAQFVRSMVQECTNPRVPFHCPEVNIKQPIAEPKALRARTKRWPI